MKKPGIDNILQWLGAVGIIAGHALGSIGPITYPYGIIASAGGGVMFLIWAIRIRNTPQCMVNVISLSILSAGILKAYGII